MIKYIKRINSQIMADSRLAYVKTGTRHQRNPLAKPSAERKLTVVSARFRQVPTIGSFRNEAVTYSWTVDAPKPCQGARLVVAYSLGNKETLDMQCSGVIRSCISCFTATSTSVRKASNECC